MANAALSFLAAAIGGAAGAFAVARLAPPTAEVASGDAVPVDELRAEVREVRALLARPPSLAPADRASSSPTPTTATSAAAGVDPAALPAAGSQLETAIERAVTAALDRRAEKEKAEKEEARAPRKKMALAEVAREINLTGAQEDAVRRAYAEATERALRMLAAPDGDPEAVRRELESARDDPSKRMALMGKYMPKALANLGELGALQVERDEKIRKAVGADNVTKMKRYRIAEEDPFNFDADVSVGISADGR
jgi:translation initiation factor 2 beta subunit (eIF-2beta)/eIF-5